MKKNSLIIALHLIAMQTIAQNKPAPQATGYVKNGQLYYQLTNCKPLGPVEIYSNSNGGSIVAAGVATEQGTVTLAIPPKVKVAFVVSRAERNVEGRPGNGYVTTLQPPVIELQSFTIQQGDVPKLQWQVKSKQPNLHFDVYRNTGNTAFEKIATVPGNVFSFTDETVPAAGSGPISYDVQVSDAGGKLRLSLGVQQVQPAKGVAVKVFPSACTDHFTVQMPPGTAGTVQVFNSTGVMVSNVAVQPGSNRISTNELAAAAYLVKVTGRDNRVLYHSRIVKQNP
jgi:hypothetical protein